MSDETDLMMELSAERQARVETEKRLFFVATQLRSLCESTSDYLVGIHNSLIGGKGSLDYLANQLLQDMSKFFTDFSDASGVAHLTAVQYMDAYTAQDGSQKPAFDPPEFKERMDELREFMNSKGIGSIDKPTEVMDKIKIAQTGEEARGLVTEALQGHDMHATSKTLLVMSQVLGLIVDKVHDRDDVITELKDQLGKMIH